MKYKIIIVSTIVTSILFSCSNHEQTEEYSEKMISSDTTAETTCPFLTLDSKGNIALSWVKKVNDSDAVMCYAISTDKGYSFGQTIEIPSSKGVKPHGENLPKMIFKPNGEIIAAWGVSNPNPESKYSGLVHYAQSFDDGKTWSNAIPLVTDSSGYDQRYIDMAVLQNGEAGIIWLDNRKTTPEEGSALYFAATVGKNGFQKERLISQPCCECCRTDLFVDSKNGIHILYRGIIKDSTRDIVHSVSVDDGKTFSAPARISNDNWIINGCPHTGPAMAENKEGLHFAWFTGGKNKGSFYTRSADNGNSFTDRDSISGLGSHPQIVSLSEGELVIVWDEAVKVNDKFYKRIGFQKRTKAGISEEKLFITPDTLTASYPVVSPLDRNTSFVAYSNKNGEKNYVAYQLIHF